MKFRTLDVVSTIQALPEQRVGLGQVGAVVEELDHDHVLVEFADLKGVAFAITPIPVGLLIKLSFSPEIARQEKKPARAVERFSPASLSSGLDVDREGPDPALASPEPASVLQSDVRPEYELHPVRDGERQLTLCRHASRTSFPSEGLPGGAMQDRLVSRQTAESSAHSARNVSLVTLHFGSSNGHGLQPRGRLFLLLRG